MTMQPDRVREGEPVKWRGAIDTTASTAGALAETTEFPSVEHRATEDLDFEKIVGRANVRPISFLEFGIRCSKPVAHITLADGSLATGFMIAPALLLTNHHVFGSAADAKGATIRFNHQADILGNLLPADAYATQPDGPSGFHTNQSLDYAVVRVVGDPGMKWGTLALARNAEIGVPEDVIIIQHPMGSPKQIAMTDNETAFVDQNVVQYLTDTLPGSSGSPVFNDLWQLIALHHSGGWIPEPTGTSTHFRNEGIRASAIAADLPRWILDELPPA